MRKYPSNIHSNNILSAVRDIAASRDEDIRDYESLRDTKMKGRLRTGVRSVPSSAADVLAGDLQGDKLNDDTYAYELVQTTSGLLWDRRSLDVGWS